jgi:hypothetical protein
MIVVVSDSQASRPHDLIMLGPKRTSGVRRRLSLGDTVTMGFCMVAVRIVRQHNSMHYACMLPHE